MVGLSSKEALGPAQLQATVGSLWEKLKDSVLARVTVLEDAVGALRSGSLGEEQRSTAEREAHKLAGSAGMFGFGAGSQLAREMELTLAGPACTSEELDRLSTVVVALRAELEGPSSHGETERRDPEGGGVILVAGADAGFVRRLSAEAGARGMTVEATADSDRAVELIDEQRPGAVVLDLGPAPTLDGGLEVLERMGQAGPGIPVIVVTAADSFLDRVRVARSGGRGFLPHPTSAEHAIDAVSRSLTAARSDDMRVLAVDDDAVVLAGLRLLLEQAGFRFTALADPTTLWESLHEIEPDLLVLDFDMPYVNGKELCRVIRNDSRWAELPVVFLTGRTDPRSVQEMFAAGGDDFVSKPIVGPELSARIANRLERVRLYRRLASTDPLTGLHNRRKSEEAVGRLLTMARRYEQHVSLGVVDLDHFKQVNDRLGHAAGDAVLRRVAAMLRQAFRGEDVVARWGGEEFVVALYGATADQAVSRLQSLLAVLRQEDVLGGHDLRISFSAGVAEFPSSGADVQLLYRAADVALYQAKEAGRNRVLAAPDPSRGHS